MYARVDALIGGRDARGGRGIPSRTRRRTQWSSRERRAWCGVVHLSWLLLRGVEHLLLLCGIRVELLLLLLLKIQLLLLLLLVVVLLLLLLCVLLLVDIRPHIPAGHGGRAVREPRE